MRPKRLKLAAPVNEDDEKSSPEISSAKVEKIERPVKLIKTDDDDNIITIPHYWPYGTNLKNAEDKSLIFLASEHYSDHRPACKQKNAAELVKMFRYSCQNKIKNVRFEEHEEAMSAFVAGLNLDKNIQIEVDPFFRHKTCKIDCNCFPNLKVNDCPFLEYFADGKTVSFYLKIDEMSTSNTANQHYDYLFSFLSKKYFRGELNNYNFKSDIFTDDASNYPIAKISKEFKLNLKDYQLRAISWMNSIEAIEENESNTIFHDFSSSDNLKMYVKFKFGEDSSYYLGLNEDRITLSTSSKTAKKETISRLFGGIISDNVGCRSEFTILGLIHMSPYCELKKINRAKRFKDLNLFVESKASLIICPCSNYETLLARARRCDPKLKVIGILDRADHMKFSYKDMQDADIVVVSASFLDSSDYSRAIEGYHLDQKLSENFESRRSVFFGKIHFYRIGLIKSCENEKLRGDYFWALGKCYSSKSSVLKHSNILETTERMNKEAREEIQHKIYRNCIE